MSIYNQRSVYAFSIWEINIHAEPGWRQEVAGPVVQTTEDADCVPVQRVNKRAVQHIKDYLPICIVIAATNFLLKIQSYFQGISAKTKHIQAIIYIKKKKTSEKSSGAFSLRHYSRNT